MNPFIDVFGLEIAWYAIIIAFGFILAAAYGISRMKQFGLDADRAIDAILAGMVGGIIGARIYYVVFSWDNYKDNLLEIFNIRNGGLAIYGGIIGALIFGLIMCKIRKVKMLPMLDVTALGFLIGQCVGRWGNFVNAEAYGSSVSDNYLLGMSVPGEEALVHPCFLYESVWCLIGFILLHFYSKRRKFDGEVGLMYLMWYGAGRMVIEGLRTDSLYLGNLRVSQILSGLLLIGALIVWLVIRSRIKRNNDPEYLKLYVKTEESKELLELAQLRNKDPKAYAQLQKEKKEERKAAKMAKKEQKVSGPEDDMEIEEAEEGLDSPDVTEQEVSAESESTEEIEEPEVLKETEVVSDDEPEETESADEEETEEKKQSDTYEGKDE
ncbi:Prolipoprotein diacylglyceryl transferase [uncultured Ruminococcus sp.]|nr:Prolipoprotein diacylglyceryl transferase [uncultured Ruminococcus sp.]SCH71660.1 Prolipoprotein diacylglyceryl transferase [uncultured Clostridium sp.]